MMRRAIPALLALALLAGPAAADSIAEEARALVLAKAQAAIAEHRSGDLENASLHAVGEAVRARIAAAAMAARVQAAEADVAAGRARVAIIARLQRDQRARLAEKQGDIVRLVGALQTMARRPTALSLVQPGSIDDLVHVRALLEAVMPVVRQRTAGLRAEVAAGRRLRAGAEQAIVALAANRAALASRRAALAQLEIEHRRKSREFATAALFESDKALAAGENAKDISSLLLTMGEQAELRARLIVLPGPLPRPRRPGDAPPPPTAAAVITPRPAYRLPALGELVTGFGEVSDAGIRARGLTIATQPGAQVIAPAAGHVSYAGTFRGWGHIVIVDHPGGWTTLVTGLASSDVDVGDEVAQGGPIGRAPAAKPRITVELRHAGQPVDLVAMMLGR